MEEFVCEILFDHTKSFGTNVNFKTMSPCLQFPYQHTAFGRGARQEVLNEQSVRILSSKAWSHDLAKGSTNICAMVTGEQGRKEPSLWCQVLPLMFLAWPCSFDYQSDLCGALWPWLLPCLPLCGENSSWAAKKKKTYWLWHSENSAFLLPTCEKEVCLKSSPALKNRSGHGTSQCLLNWDWILIFFDQISSLEAVWALNLGYWCFRNTTFLFLSDQSKLFK